MFLDLTTFLFEVPIATMELHASYREQGASLTNLNDHRLLL